MKGLTLKLIIFLTLGIICVLLGATVILTRYSIHEYIKYIVLRLAPNSEMYKNWIKNPFPLQLDLYIFNWTNPEDIFNKSIKPEFVEIGPYKFDEIKEKVNLVWNDNQTLTYNMKKTWYFQKDQNVSLSDNVTTINAVNFIAAFHTKYWSYIRSSPLAMYLGGFSSKIGIVKKVEEILFKGYTDFLMTLGNVLNENEKGMDKFSVLYQRNASASYEGDFNIDINYANNGQVLEWNYKNISTAMEKKCNNLRASSVDLFKQNLKPSDDFEFFFSDICRPLLFNYVGEVTVKGIKGYKYTVADRMLDNGTKIPGNDCYCNGECIPSGIINVTSCKYNIPLFLSLPHFYNADPFYVNRLKGIQPEKSKHEFYIILEPETGILLETAAKMQVNMFVKPYDHIRIYNDLPNILIPYLWFEQKILLPDDYVFKVKLLLETPKIIMLNGFIIIVIGIIIIFFAIRKILKNKNKLEEETCKQKIKEIELMQDSNQNVKKQITRLKNGQI